MRKKAKKVQPNPIFYRSIGNTDEGQALLAQVPRTSQLITVDNLAQHIASHYKNVEFAGDPRVNSLSFFLKLTQPIGVMRALIIFSYDDNLFYYDEFANDERINKRSFHSNSLRKVCEYIRGTSFLSLKKMIVVDTTEISIGFFEHFGIAFQDAVDSILC